MHDLRSPLLSCLNVTEQMRELPADMPMGDARVVESVDAMHACSALMENIVRGAAATPRGPRGRAARRPRGAAVARVVRTGV